MLNQIYNIMLTIKMNTQIDPYILDSLFESINSNSIIKVRNLLNLIPANSINKYNIYYDGPLPDKQMKSINTPLYAAVKLNNIDIARMLLSKGANVNQHICRINKIGKYPLGHSIKHNNNDMFDLLLKYNAIIWKPNYGLYCAWSSANYYLMGKMIELGANVDSNDLLARSVNSNCQIGMLEWLLDHGTNINKVSVYSNTALYIATRKGYINIATKLLERGADPNIAKSDDSCLFQAIYSHNILLTELLLKHGADPNVMNHSTLNTPLLVSSEINNNDAYVRLLLKFGADMNILNCYGDTALHIAVNKYNLKVVKVLLEHGADPYQVNNRNESSYDDAKKLSQEKGKYRISQSLTNVAIAIVELIESFDVPVKGVVTNE